MRRRRREQGGKTFGWKDSSQAKLLSIRQAEAALSGAGYDLARMHVLIRADLPARYRAMTLEDGAVLGSAAFESQDLLNYVLEEELLHLEQKAVGRADVFGPGTAAALEEEINVKRRFRWPGH